MTSTDARAVDPPLEAPDPVDEALQEVVESYEAADRFVREVGTFSKKAVIPALNELRYAGHHVIQAIDHNDRRVVDADKLRSARSHCRRAMYEASEAGIMFAASAVLSVHAAYPNIVISEVVRDYHEFRVRAKRAQDLVNRGRADRASVLDHTHAYMEAFRGLREAVDVLDAASDDLNAKVAARQLGDRRFFQRIALAIVALALSLTGVAVSACPGTGEPGVSPLPEATVSPVGAPD